MTTVFVRGLEFYGHHGVPTVERVLGHRYRVDLVMSVDESASETDDVRDTVDYAEAAQHALEVAQGGQYFTVERLASLIGKTLIERHPRMASVSVTVAKLLPPMPLVVAEVGTTVVTGRLDPRPRTLDPKP